MRALMNGAEAITRAAMDSGCSFFAGYPITPATHILLQMMRELPKAGGVAIQAEDEIAAIGLCIGATTAGARAFTATSGPGISLYSENLGLAIMAEIPLVIVNVQRMGPATGGATTTAQGDIQFMRWGTSGGYPMIVLSPEDVVSSYTLTRRGFDLAERFRTPVIIATEKETVATNQTIELSALEAVPVRERKVAVVDGDFIPYAFEQPDHIPAMAHFGGPHLVRFNTSTHDEYGYLTKDPAKTAALNNYLVQKIEAHQDEIEIVDMDLDPGADTLIVSYGVSARSARVAVQTAREAGKKVSLLVIYSIWPVPKKAIQTALQDVRNIIVPELNHGQYQLELERIALDGQTVTGIHRVDGELLEPDEILLQGGLI